MSPQISLSGKERAYPACKSHTCRHRRLEVTPVQQETSNRFCDFCPTVHYQRHQRSSLQLELEGIYQPMALDAWESIKEWVIPGVIASSTLLLYWGRIQVGNFI